VIKVESPASPDPIRFYPPMKNGVSVFYSVLNKGKKSLSLDYRSEEGKKTFLKLVETADVVVEQFRPGVMQAFSLGFEALKKANPKIILVSITGYGQQGEMAQFPGHDINYLAYSGMLDGMRDSTDNPVLTSTQIADVAGGSMMALNAVTTALLHRERTSEGQHVDVSMAKSVATLQSLRIAEEKATGIYNDHLSGRLASYNIYRCADDEYIALGALEPKFWLRFCELVEHPEWQSEILEDDQAELIKNVREMFVTHPRKYWTDKLEAKGVCLSPVLSVQKAAKHPLFKSGFPIPLGDRKLAAAPELGADNDSVL